MYHYIYDSFLSEKKYDRVLAKIENSLANFEINGKITKLTKLRSIEDNVIGEIKNGADNIVVVGDDVTVLKIINIIAEYKTDLTLGIIPLGYELELAKLFGIPYGAEACEILSSRKIETIDLGKANNKYFVSNINLGGNGNIEIICDGLYSIKALGNSEMRVCNIFAHPSFKGKYFDPRDGIFEIFVGHKQSLRNKLFKKEKLEESIFPIRKCVITSKKPTLLTLDKHVNLKTPVEINILPQKLKVIVGKGRVF